MGDMVDINVFLDQLADRFADRLIKGLTGGKNKEIEELEQVNRELVAKNKKLMESNKALVEEIERLKKVDSFLLRGNGNLGDDKERFRLENKKLEEGNRILVEENKRLKEENEKLKKVLEGDWNIGFKEQKGVVKW